LKESLKNLETTFKDVFYPDEGIDEEIVKDKNLYDSNHERV
jgi:hypothetical protein